MLLAGFIVAPFSGYQFKRDVLSSLFLSQKPGSAVNGVDDGPQTQELRSSFDGVSRVATLSLLRFWTSCCDDKGRRYARIVATSHTAFERDLDLVRFVRRSRFTKEAL